MSAKSTRLRLNPGVLTFARLFAVLSIIISWAFMPVALEYKALNMNQKSFPDAIELDDFPGVLS
jgi:hypothetical protein